MLHCSAKNRVFVSNKWLCRASREILIKQLLVREQVPQGVTNATNYPKTQPPTRQLQILHPGTRLCVLRCGKTQHNRFVARTSHSLLVLMYASELEVRCSWTEPPGGPYSYQYHYSTLRRAASPVVTASGVCENERGTTISADNSSFGGCCHVESLSVR